MQEIKMRWTWGRWKQTFDNIKLYQLVAQAVFDHFERVGGDEPNCSEVMVRPDMKPEDVAKVVLEKVNVKWEDAYL